MSSHDAVFVIGSMYDTPDQRFLRFLQSHRRVLCLVAGGLATQLRSPFSPHHSPLLALPLTCLKISHGSQSFTMDIADLDPPSVVLYLPQRDLTTRDRP